MISAAPRTATTDVADAVTAAFEWTMLPSYTPPLSPPFVPASPSAPVPSTCRSSLFPVSPTTSSTCFNVHRTKSPRSDDNPTNAPLTDAGNVAAPPPPPASLCQFTGSRATTRCACLVMPASATRMWNSALRSTLFSTSRSRSSPRSVAACPSRTTASI